MAGSYKLTTWNIEWVANLLRDLKDAKKSVAHRGRLQQRLEAIHQAIREMNPDVLCITEGPNGEALIDEFLDGMPEYVAVKRPSGDPYRQSGRQWIWFVIRKELSASASLLPVAVWRQYTEDSSPSGEHKANWPVHRWGQIETTSHGHYRHPQVLRLTLAGTPVELIGAHFKSKLTRVGNFTSANPETRRAYIEETIEARVKLATEAQNLRYYVDHRFRQERSPAIFAMGDFNDGPGKELIERQFLFFDLLDNLQGDVFEAEKFLNHALFDYPDELRWTVHFVDRIDPDRDPHILIDHIMFTQALVRNEIPLRVPRQGGLVEHEIFDRLNAQLPSGQRLSDHKPVSCLVNVTSG